MSQRINNKEFKQKLKKQLSFINPENINDIEQIKSPKILEQKKQPSFQEQFKKKISKITKAGTQEELKQTKNPIKLDRINSDPYLLQEQFLKPRKKSILKNKINDSLFNQQQTKKKVSFIKSRENFYLPKIKQNHKIEQLEESSFSQKKMKNNTFNKILKKQPSFQELFKEKISTMTKAGPYELIQQANKPVELIRMQSDPYLPYKNNTIKEEFNTQNNKKEQILSNKSSFQELFKGKISKINKKGPKYTLNNQSCNQKNQ